jgi:homoserine kinase
LIKIRVPATSANIGAGFDCMGLALDIFNEVGVEINDGGLIINTDGDIPRDETNLVFSSIVAGTEYIKKHFSNNSKRSKFLTGYLKNPSVIKNLTITQKNNIPVSSGMGSSAACVVAGILAADALCGGVLSEDELISIATATDGHPDNVVPALIGAISASIAGEDGRVHYLRINPPKPPDVVLFVPSFRLPTSASRKALPKLYKREDTVFNIGRAVLTFASLTSGDLSLLKHAVGDRIHQPYRQGLIANYDDVFGFAKKCGAIACYLSGAGPTIAAFCDKSFDDAKMQTLLDGLPDKWKVLKCRISEYGATTEI